jgi:hypothetical protein
LQHEGIEQATSDFDIDFLLLHRPLLHFSIIWLHDQTESFQKVLEKDTLRMKHTHTYIYEREHTCRETDKAMLIKILQALQIIATSFFLSNNLKFFKANQFF